MAYKCIQSNYTGRLFEQGDLYDSIGEAPSRFFEEVEVDEDAQVVETGLAPVEDLEREAVKAELTELNVSFNGRAKTATLQRLLAEARQLSLLA